MIECEHRLTNSSGQAVCGVVQKLTGLPIAYCLTTDDACRACLGMSPSQDLNRATASMSFTAWGTAGRDPQQLPKGIRDTLTVKVAQVAAAQVPCTMRGNKLRDEPCRTCESGTGKPFAEVYSCTLLTQCTLQSTAIHPRIQGCTTCEKRTVEKIPAKPYPPEVLAVLNAKINYRADIG